MFHVFILLVSGFVILVSRLKFLPMSRQYTRIGHLLRLIQLIRSRSGQNVKDLAEACGRDERTIYRDLKTLNESGIPCTFDKETGGYRVHPGFFMPPVELTFEEAMATVALLEQIDDDTQIPFLDTAQRVAEKIRSQLPAGILKEIETLDGHLQIDLARTISVDDSLREVYNRVRTAIATTRLLKCRYDSVHSTQDDGKKTFEFRPYALWYSQRAWYAVGKRSDRDDIRLLKLNRFTYTQLTDHPYHIPEDFDLQQFIGNAWRMIRGDKEYKVAIRFQPDFAETVSDTRWHATQTEQWHDDGSVTLRFTVSSLAEITFWILGYGPGAKVESPPELVQEVRDLAAAMVKRYEE
jgi:proteasome accessory factor B